jgi:hypothetical protein
VGPISRVSSLAVLVLVLTAAILARTDAAQASFGFSETAFDVAQAPEGEPDTASEMGAADVQAGSHPWAISVSFAFHTTDANGATVPDGNVKDIQLTLPPGFAGDGAAIPTCTMQEFHTPALESTYPPGSSLENSGASCSEASQVGVAELDMRGYGSLSFGVYNLQPSAGIPAELGVNVVGIPIVFFASLGSGGEGRLTLSLSDATQFERLFSGRITIWGVPGDPRHDPFRGRCLGEEGQSVEEFPHQCALQGSPAPFLTLPTSCSSEPLTATVRADSWQQPGNFVEAVASNDAVGVTGCEHLGFDPRLSAQSEASAADTPSGLTVDLRTPPEESPYGLARSRLRSAVLTLPAGWSISSAAADVLQGCASTQVGFSGLDPQTGADVFTPNPAGCPTASTLGTIEVSTPLVPSPLRGSIYLGQQGESLRSASPGAPFVLYAVAGADGIAIKQAVHLQADPATGQLTATLENLPQQPLSDIKLTFNGGPEAVLATPEDCGTSPLTVSLTPYSSQAPTVLASPLSVTAGCAGGFSPSLQAGSFNPQAGAYSPFTATFSRGDEDQPLAAISLSTPPGVLATLAKIPLCLEAGARAGTCPPNTAVGHAIVGLGAGADPTYLPQSGQPQAPIYLTGPYDGAPFGLSIVVPALAGPFDLGAEVLRASIAIDPQTAALTIASDPLPSILDGIPLRIRLVNLTFDREGFTLNPTNCDPLLVRATVTGAQGASVRLSNRFQVANCARLPFSPKLGVLTYANGEFAGHGAYLHIRVSTAPGQANLRSLKLDLPQRLPARLATVQRACSERTFKQDPSSCPSASLIGSASALTPLLGAPLLGPVYLVSHGGRSFPDVVLVLKADGVAIDLSGELYVDSNDVTSAIFRALPDVPIRRLDLILREGRSSALVAGASLCAKALSVSSTIVGQNGARVSHTVHVEVKGCRRVARRAVPARHKIHTAI